jgi:uncharacterized membrane-anchored protein
MGIETMFNLESKICEWRSIIAESSAVTHKDSDELESHLRDSFAELVIKGLNESEAFMIASLRLGSPDKISKEYRKVNGNYIWRRRALWLVVGWLSGNALVSASGGLGTIAGATTAWAGFDSTSTGLVSMIVTMVCWGVSLYLFWRSSRRAHIVTPRSSVSIVGLVSLIAILTCGHFLSIVGMNVYVQNLPADQLANVAFWRAAGALGLYVCIIATCAAMIISLRRTEFEDGEIIA